MQSPIRLTAAIRPTLPTGLLAAATLGAVLFAVTPFLVAPVAAELGIGLGVAGLLSTAQLAGFAIGSWAGPRLLDPSRKVAIGAVCCEVAANLSAATLPSWPILLGTRVVSGLGLGLVAWLAWREAFGHERRTGELNLAAPLATAAATPVIGWLSVEHGASALFLAMAGASLVPLVLPLTPSDDLPAAVDDRSHAPRPVRPALVLLVALGLFTCGGSAVFTFAAVVGLERLDLSTSLVSGAFVANALVGAGATLLPRLHRRRFAGAWFALSAAAAVAVCLAGAGPLYVFAMVGWGFAFYAGMPAAFALLAARSRYPAERAGDAQAVMAVGRIVGPALGGALVTAGSLRSLGLAAALLMGASAVLVAAVYRRWDVIADAPDAQPIVID